MNDIGDKNKAVHKLKGLPHIYCINLDDKVDRWESMESQFKYWEIENYTRVSAYDGREDDLGGILKGRYPDNMNSGEVGCVTSHLKALKEFLNSGEQCALIMEDDCDINTTSYWPFSWKDFFCKVPYDYDVVQIAIICTGDLHVRLHKRFVNDFSTACYIINRHHAEKLIRLHCRGGYTGEQKYKLDNGCKPRPVADDLIYNCGNTFSIPLLLYKMELGSSIHQEHIDWIHKGNHDALTNFWVTNGSNVNIKEYMDYDPYLGRITENSNHKQEG